MTLQIAILGIDGIVVATDIQIKRTPSGEGDVEIHRYDRSKVMFSDDGIFCAAVAGMLHHEQLYGNLLAFIATADWDDEREIADGCRSIWERHIGNSTEKGWTGIIFASAKRTGGFYARLFSEVAFTRIRAVSEPELAWGLKNGHEANGAYYFIRRHLPRETKMPVASLMRIAAHYILMAGKISPDMIGGLDMFVSRSGGAFRQISTESITCLSKECLEFDRNTEEFLLTPLSLQEIELRTSL